jgi:hypothetical protein
LTAANALSVIAFLASFAVLVATGTQRPIARLAEARLACALLTGSLVAASFGDLIARWALAVSCIGFLLSVQAIALAFGYLAPLQSYLDRRAAVGDAAWWADFEQSFGRYATRRSRRRRLRRTVARVAERSPVDTQDHVQRDKS